MARFTIDEQGAVTRLLWAYGLGRVHDKAVNLEHIFGTVLWVI